MGFGTSLFTQIYYSHQTWNSKDDLREHIEELSEWIGNEKETIRQFALMTEPTKLWRQDEAEVGETPMIWILNNVEESLRSLEEYIREKQFLELLCDHWEECHTEDGDPIEPPADSKLWEKSYIWGDFITSKNQPKPNY